MVKFKLTVILINFYRHPRLTLKKKTSNTAVTDGTNAQVRTCSMPLIAQSRQSMKSLRPCCRPAKVTSYCLLQHLQKLNNKKKLKNAYKLIISFLILFITNWLEEFLNYYLFLYLYKFKAKINCQVPLS